MSKAKSIHPHSAAFCFQKKGKEMTIINFLPLLAGIGLFLFGMNYLSGALEKLAGAKLEKLLEKLTSNRVKGLLLGTGVTAVIQSSSATTIMILGLLNAGIINLVNAIPVIMGANIGTTVTAQILRLGDLGGGSVALSLLKPSAFGPVLIAIGAFLILFCKGSKKKDIGSLFLGLGMIFFGISTMENTLTPLKEMPWFINMLSMFNNPFLGVLIGALITALLQSSSASVGIVQALSATGAIRFNVMVPVILGMNVGKCITVVLASIGGKKNSKRAVLIDVTNNVLGMVIFMVGIYGIRAAGLISNELWTSTVTRGNIADFHTCFNLITGLLLLPCISLLIRYANAVVKDDDSEEEEEKVLAALNEQMLKSPNLAIEQSRKAVIAMVHLTRKNFRDSLTLFEDYSEETIEKINARENLLDKYESSVSNYLVRISHMDITDHDNLRVNEMMHSVVDLERIGDHAVNIMEVAIYDHENDITFSPRAMAELNMISQACLDIIVKCTKILEHNDLPEAFKVEPLEEVIDQMQRDLKDLHIQRLCNNQCNIHSGISFVELLQNLERVSDHCSNIALNMINTAQKGGMDLHAYEEEVHKNGDEVYQEAYQRYLDRYNLSTITISYDEPAEGEADESLKEDITVFDLPNEKEEEEIIPFKSKNKKDKKDKRDKKDKKEGKDKKKK